MPIPPELAGFDIAGAEVTIWAFKKSGVAAGAPPKFVGRWIETDDPLDAALKTAVEAARAKIDEVEPYGLLAESSEGGALHITTIETHADLIVAAAADALAQRRVKVLKQLQNTSFYVIKLVSNGQVLHAVRKTDASWGTKKRMSLIDVVFDDQTLTLETRPPFSLSRNIDFLVLDGDIYILNKAAFESVLSYKQAHADEFQALQAEPQFASLFTNLAPLIDYVGTNKLFLRRVCAIKAKGHYLDAAFMDRLRQHHAQYHLTLQFTPAGLLDPTPATCGDIITALLDHRVYSAFSQAIYDVPNAVEVI